MSLQYQEILSKLVSFSTVSYTNESNKDIIYYLSELFEEFENTKIEISQITDNPGKYNLFIGIYPNADKEDKAGQGLLFSGHVDTVPTAAEQWDSDPNILTLKNNKYYGLGSVDMKGFFAYVYTALKNTDLSQLKEPIYIVATADEETTMCGAADFVEHATIRPALAIVGEPSMLKPFYAHKGQLAVRVDFSSESGHSSNELKNNAFAIALEFIENLKEFADEIKMIRDESFAIPYTTYNLASMHGGDAPNRICGDMRFEFDMRPLPKVAKNKEEAIELAQDLEEHLTPLFNKYAGQIEMTHLHPPFAGFVCEDLAIRNKIMEITGEEEGTISYCTEAPYFNSLCPTLILGAGDIAQAHRANEFVAVEQCEKAIKVYTKLIKELVC